MKIIRKILIFASKEAILMNPEIFTKHLSEPWFTFVCSGVKSVEGRLNQGSWATMKVGDIIIFYNEDKGTRTECKVVIVEITHHKSFDQMLRKHGLSKTLPNKETIKEGVEVYHNIYKPLTQDENIGVLGFVMVLL